MRMKGKVVARTEVQEAWAEVKRILGEDEVAHFLRSEVKKSIILLKTKTATGPDGIV